MSINSSEKQRELYNYEEIHKVWSILDNKIIAYKFIDTFIILPITMVSATMINISGTITVYPDKRSANLEKRRLLPLLRMDIVSYRIEVQEPLQDEYNHL